VKDTSSPVSRSVRPAFCCALLDCADVCVLSVKDTWSSYFVILYIAVNNNIVVVYNSYEAFVPLLRTTTVKTIIELVKTSLHSDVTDGVPPCRTLYVRTASLYCMRSIIIIIITS